MASYVIDINENNIPHGLTELLGSIPDRDKLNDGDVITIKFGDSFVFTSTLVLLASWRNSLPPNIHVNIDEAGSTVAVQAMITNTGFREIIETGHERPSVHRRPNKVPLCPLTNQINKDDAVKEIASLFSNNTTGNIDKEKAFTTIIGELCENALTHSDATSPGYVSAGVTENDDGKKFEIIVCDTGVGFRNSYLSGTNETVANKIKRGASPIEIAIEGLNSSKPRVPYGGISYYGFGLYITRKLVEANNGHLYIISQNDCLTFNNGVPKAITLENHFRGTLIVVILYPENELPLERIYQDTEKYSAPDEKNKSKDTVVNAQEDSKLKERNSRVALKDFGEELLTREVGLAIRADIATKIISSGYIQIDLDGISDITPSVADEAFGKLAESIGIDKFRNTVFFNGGTTLARRLIEFVLKTRSDKSNA